MKPAGPLISLLLALLAFPLLTADVQARVERLDSQTRKRVLRKATEQAELIIVGTVLDTTIIAPENNDIRTCYTLRIDHLLKADEGMPSEVQFCELGGATGSRARLITPSVSYKIGHSYLIFLARCDDVSAYTTSCMACVAEITGETAKVTNPSVIVSTQALRDSVSTFMAALEPAYQKARSDLVVVARVTSVSKDDVDAPAHLVDLTVDAEVQEIVWKREGLGVSPQESFQLQARYPIAADLADGATRAQIIANADYLFFIRREGGEWRLGPSMYCAYRKVADQAVVDAAGYPCGRPHVIASRAWDGLVSELR